MTGARHHRNRRKAAEVSDAAREEGRRIAERYRQELSVKGGARATYGPTLTKIVTRCNAFLKLPNEVDLGVFSGPPMGHPPATPDHPSSMPDVWKEIDRVLVRVEALKEMALTANKHIRIEPNSKTKAARWLIQDLAKVWERDTGKRASQYMDGNFRKFASEICRTVGLTLTKPQLEMALKDRRRRRR